ncbi:MAG: three-Cys-motif partner protein TcmP [Candidatus Hydrogenedentes bacterium]|nr:three-Cys-motif partner protein TcmP [Candidatus Hydrogenedentota bacterium]
MTEHFDEIVYWSEVKLDIVQDYAVAYSRILANQKRFHHVYIDAFAGRGLHISRSSGDFIPGSPLNALNVLPPFCEFFLIDLDSQKADALRQSTKEFPSVHVFEGDCNSVMHSEVFPKVRHEDYRRGLCLPDPYGLHLDWTVIRTAGQMKSIEIFLNFPVMDMNRNVLWRDPDAVSPDQIERMNAFWGDNSWRQAAYTTELNLFGYEEKRANDEIAAAFRTRLKEVAGFAYVPDPIPMRNSIGAVVYYLFFASPNRTGSRIVKYIFDKYRERGAR